MGKRSFNCSQHTANNQCAYCNGRPPTHQFHHNAHPFGPSERIEGGIGIATTPLTYGGLSCRPDQFSSEIRQGNLFTAIVVILFDVSSVEDSSVYFNTVEYRPAASPYCRVRNLTRVSARRMIMAIYPAYG